MQAQVEVYQSDFNAERTARERIAGEKADLEEQLRKIGNDGVGNVATGVAGSRRVGGGVDNTQGGNNGRRRDGSTARGGDQHHLREVADIGRRDFVAQGQHQMQQDHNHYNNGVQYDNIPRTVNTRYFNFLIYSRLTKLWFRPDPPATNPAGGEDLEAFACPKCNKEFRNMTLLTRYR